MKLRTISSVVTLLSVCGVSAVGAAPVYSPVTGSYYDYINRDIQDQGYTTWTWEDARLDAQARSYMGRQGHLVTLTSQAEEQIILDNWFVDVLYGQPWLGGYREPGSDPLTGWQWVTGEAFNYTNWGLGEPNNAGGNEFFLHYQSVNVSSVDVYDRYGWNDASSAYRASYFIEYSAVPTSGPLSLLLLGWGALVGLGRLKRSRP